MTFDGEDRGVLRTRLDRLGNGAHGTPMPYKSALIVLTLAIVPLLYFNVWLSLGTAIAAYVIAARLANRQMDRVFLIRSLKGRSVSPRPRSGR